MTKLISLFLLGCYATSSVATEAKKNKKIEPLSEQFLLFLAEMEPVDGKWVHPVDLTSVTANQQRDPKQSVTQNKATPTSKQTSKQTKDGKRDDDN